MLAYTARRLLLTLPVMLVVAFFVFSLLNLTPGDPVILLAGEDATAQDIARIRASLSLDQPFFFRFAQWLWRVVQGDLGESIFTGLSVSHMIGQHLTPTITLMLMTLVSSMLIAIPLGALAAWFRNGAFDRLVVMLTVVSFSIPSFVIGYLIAWIVGIKFGLRPVQGYIPFSEGFWASLRTLILPTVALCSAYVALITRITRATLLETLTQDYIRTARAKGVSDETVLFRHALKNVAVPVITVIGSGVALLIGGAVITETVFSIPGIGRLTVDAILRRDYPIIQGVILMFSFMYVLVNLGVDLLYRIFDPRIKY